MVAEDDCARWPGPEDAPEPLLVGERQGEVPSLPLAHDPAGVEHLTMLDVLGAALGT